MNSLKTFAGALLIITLCITIEANQKANLGVRHPNKAAIVGKTYLNSNQRAKQGHLHSEKKFEILNSKPSKKDDKAQLNDPIEIELKIQGDATPNKNPCKGEEGSCLPMQSVKDEVDVMKNVFKELSKKMNEMATKSKVSEDNTKHKLDELKTLINIEKCVNQKSVEEMQDKLEDKLSSITKEMANVDGSIDDAVKKSEEETEKKLNRTIEEKGHGLESAIRQSAQCGEQITYGEKREKTALKCYWLGRIFISFVGYGTISDIPSGNSNLVEQKNSLDDCVILLEDKHRSDSKWNNLVYKHPPGECHIFKAGFRFSLLKPNRLGERNYYSTVNYRLEVVDAH